MNKDMDKGKGKQEDGSESGQTLLREDSSGREGLSASVPYLPYASSAASSSRPRASALSLPALALDLDIERGGDELLVRAEPERPRTPATRAARIVRRVPGVDRTLRFANWVLGPKHRQAPPPPKPGLAFTATCGRKRSAAPLDAATRRTSRMNLPRLWFPFLLLWATGFVLLVRAAYYLPHAPEPLSCTSAFFEDWPPDACGVNGTKCAAGFEASTYRCPGRCSTTTLGNPRFIGAKKVNGVPLIVGGGDEMGTYRADSWVCAAGVHAGIVSPTYGGCVNVAPLSDPEGYANFLGSKGSGGLTSAPFSPHFPFAFRLSPAGTAAQCIEFHWPIMAYNVILLFVFTAFFTPPPHVLAAVLLVMGYLQITLASDVKSRPPDWSFILGGIPPLLLAGYWFWNVAFRTTLTAFISAGLSLDMAVWQGAGFWIGIESSTLFARIPISRLGYGALSAGGIASLVIVIVVVVAVVAVQALTFRRLGYLRYYLTRYLPLVPILIILGNLGHGYYLRLHHYLLCMAGIPVLSLPNRISLFGQAFLLGFFLDGVGRWGWASILEFETQLRGDSIAGSIQPAITAMSTMLNWKLNSTLLDLGVTGVSVLFDDLLWSANYVYTNLTVINAGGDPSVDHYVRLAFYANGSSLDYSTPWTWYSYNQSWIH